MHTAQRSSCMSDRYKIMSMTSASLGGTTKNNLCRSPTSKKAELVLKGSFNSFVRIAGVETPCCIQKDLSCIILTPKRTTSGGHLSLLYIVRFASFLPFASQFHTGKSWSASDLPSMTKLERFLSCPPKSCKTITRTSKCWL